MTGETERYWPTTKAYADDLNCPDCGALAWTCPCAIADNAVTGMGDDEARRDTLLPYFGPEDAA